MPLLFKPHGNFSAAILFAKRYNHRYGAELPMRLLRLVVMLQYIQIIDTPDIEYKVSYFRLNIDFSIPEYRHTKILFLRIDFTFPDSNAGNKFVTNGYGHSVLIHGCFCPGLVKT